MDGQLVLLPGLRIKEGSAAAGADDCIIFNPQTDFIFQASPSVVSLIRMFAQPRDPEEAVAEFMANNQCEEAEVRGVLKDLIDEQILVSAGVPR